MRTIRYRSETPEENTPGDRPEALAIPIQPTNRISDPCNWCSAVFVWGVWSLLLVIALGFVGRYGSPIPFWDDWGFVPYLTGEAPVTASWLWSQVNEHRIPVSKLILLASYKLSGGDFRAGMFLNVLGFGMLAFALIRAARAVRGRTCFADAFFPVVLLSTGHARTFLWSMTFTDVVPSVLVGAVLIVIVRGGGQLTLRSAALSGLCLVMLPLCGGTGLAYVPAITTWLGYVGYRLRRAPEAAGRKAGLVAWSASIAAVLLVGAYFIGYQKIHFDPSESSPRSGLGLYDFFKTTLKFLTISFGPAAVRFWPVSGVLTASLMLITAVLLAAAIRRHRAQELQRDLGLLAFITGCACLALAIGWGRSKWDPWYILDGRFAARAVPVLCGVYFVWEICSPPFSRPLFRMALFALVLSALLLNVSLGVDWAKHSDELHAGLERDLRAGVPISLLIKRHTPALHPFHEASGRLLRSLHRAGIEKYRLLREDPPFREVRLPAIPTGMNQVTWEGGAGHATGNEPYLVFDLPEPMFVCGIRIRFSHSNDERMMPYFQLFWRERHRGEFADPNRYCHFQLATGGKEVEVPVWIYDRIDQIRIHPDRRPCDFKISEIVLLLSTNESG